VSDTAVVAAITALTALAGAFLGGFLYARSALVTATAIARAERFSSWQTHKREVYAHLLRTIHDQTGPSSDGTTPELGDALARAIVVANRDLRDHLMELESNVFLARKASYRRDLVERLMADVRQAGAST
jgi:hypothetical protein